MDSNNTFGSGGSTPDWGGSTPDWALPPVTVGVPVAPAGTAPTSPAGAPVASDPPSLLRLVLATCAAAGAIVTVFFALVCTLLGVSTFLEKASNVIDLGGGGDSVSGVSINGTLLLLCLVIAAIAYGTALAVTRTIDVRTAIAGALGALIGTASMIAAAAVWLISAIIEAFAGTGLSVADKADGFVHLLPHTARYGLLPALFAVLIGVVLIYATGRRIGRAR